jgi:hypothetical protein
VNADSAVQIDAEVETELDDRLELAKTIYQLYGLGLIAEEMDASGTPRFRPTGQQP